jgi:hypothetical protein
MSGETQEIVICSFSKMERATILWAGVPGLSPASYKTLYHQKAGNLFRIIDRVFPDSFGGTKEGLFKFPEHGQRLMEFASVSRVRYFPQSRFVLSIDNDVVSIAPEALDLLLEGLRKMDHDG